MAAVVGETPSRPRRTPRFSNDPGSTDRTGSTDRRGLMFANDGTGSLSVLDSVCGTREGDGFLTSLTLSLSERMEIERYTLVCSGARAAPVLTKLVLTKQR